MNTSVLLLFRKELDAVKSFVSCFIAAMLLVIYVMYGLLLNAS